jgi:tetratricopeptide (TPR) repeat protein
MLRILGLSLCLMVAACANQGGGAKSSYGNQKQAYQQAEAFFKHGKVMQARERLLAIKTTDADYEKAQALLNKTVEPSRQRLMSYHRKKAEQAKANQQWYVALQQYQQAAELSEDSQDQKAVATMQLRLRSARAQALYVQRQREDQQFLAWQDDYQPTKTLDANDQAFRVFHHLLQEDLDHRVKQSIAQAKKLKKNAPELAYVLLLSAERLDPEAVDDSLIENIKAAVPEGVNVKPEQKKVRHVNKRSRTSKAENRVDVAQIKDLVKQKKWLKLQAFVPALKQSGRKGKALLKAIHQGSIAAAADWYAQGRKAFAAEHIDDAVRFWDHAVELNSDNDEYLNALQRALQLQEQLHIIQKQQ